MNVFGALPIARVTGSPERVSDRDPIVVVGAGVVGAAIAHHLARAGHKVVILDRGAPAEGVSGASFAWVGLAKSPAAAYADSMRSRGRAEFDRVLSELTEPIGLRASGAVTWEATDDATRRFVADHQAAGHRMELLTRDEVLEREPALRTAPEVAAYAPDDVGVDPVAYTQALLHSARQHGAEVRTNTAVTRLLTDGVRVRGVDTENGEIAATSVVLAAGTASVGLAATVGIDIAVTASPCCLLRFSVDRPLARSILSTPEFEIRQLDDTTLLAAEDVPVDFSGDLAELAAPTLAAIRTQFRGAENVRLEGAVIADRPIPTDGTPLVGAAQGMPGLHLAIAHPGVILSAEIGRRVAADHAARR